MAWSKDEKKNVIRFFVIAVTLLLVFKFLFPLVGPLLVSFLVCMLLQPAVNWLSARSSIGKTAWGIVLLFILTLVLFGLFTGLFYFVGKRFLFFFEDLDAAMLSVQRGMDDIFGVFEDCFHLQRGYLLEGMFQIFDKLKVSLWENKLSDLFSGSFALARFLIRIGMYLVVFYVGSALLFRDMHTILGFFQKHLGGYGQKIGECVQIYLLSELKIMSVIACICLFGYLASGQSGAFFLAVLTAFVDMLPFIGTGIILVPFGLFLLLMEDYVKGIILLVTYGACLLARQFLEPKLIGSKVGVPPFLTLAGLYIGVKVFGAIGLILGPFYVLLLSAIYKELFSDA